MNIDKTIQLFIDAYNHNWDYGINKIKKILKDPNCDKGTALVIYWLFQPEYYYNLEASKIKGDLKKKHAVLMKLESDLIDSKFPEIIAYDPSELFKHSNAEDVKKVPDVLKVPSKGAIKYQDILNGKVGIGSWFKAAEKGSLELLKELYQKEIKDKDRSINIKDQWSLTAIDYLCFSEKIASFEDVKNCMEFILENGGKKPKLTSVSNVKTFALEKIDFLLKNGVKINSKDYGRNALYFAGDPKVAQYLIDKKIDVNMISKIGETPLHGLFNYHENYTVGIEKVEVAPVCKILLSAGVDPNIKCNSNETALDRAKKCKRKDIDLAIKMLEDAMI